MGKHEIKGITALCTNCKFNTISTGLGSTVYYDGKPMYGNDVFISFDCGMCQFPNLKKLDPFTVADLMKSKALFVDMAERRRGDPITQSEAIDLMVAFDEINTNQAYRELVSNAQS